MSTPFLLLRANDVCFLGSARSCAAANVPTHAVTYTWEGAGPWYSEHSALVPDPRVIANPFSDAAAAAAGLRDVVCDIGPCVAVPSSDTNLMFLLDHPEVPVMAGARPDIVAKDSCGEQLAAGGVPIPRTFGCRRVEDIEPIVEQMVYPCIYKPATKDYGQTFYSKHDGRKAIDAKTPDQLRTSLAAELEAGFPLVVQERVEFDSVHDEIPCYVYVDANHEVRMAATAIKHTIMPHPYGTATVLYLSWHPELLEPARAVAKALGYRGILMIEFIRDLKDGIWKVIEVNPRPWLFVDFFRRFGLNYLQMLHEDLAGDTAHWPALRLPEPSVLREQPVHISLPAAVAPHLERLDRPPTEEDVAAFLESLPGRRTLTFLDPGDPQPGIEELHELADRYRLKRDRLVAMVQNTLSGD